MQHTLESNKWFTPIAWAIVIGFTLFTGKLAFDLHQTATALAEYTAGTNYLPSTD